MMSHSLHGQLFPFLLGAHETQQTVYRSNSFVEFLRTTKLSRRMWRGSKNAPLELSKTISKHGPVVG